MIRSIRVSLNRMGSLVTAEPNHHSGCFYQSVRWRKRRTDPIAKSKIGRVRIPTPIDPAEYKFGQIKWEEYNILLNCVRNHCVEEMRARSKETAAGVSLVEQQAKDKEEWQALLAWNDQENEKTRLIREERLAEEAKQKEERKLEVLMEKEREEEKWLEELRELVRKEKEASKSYITLENLDEAIEAAMADEKDYLFGIDREGNVTSLPENTAWTELRARIEENEEPSSLSVENLEDAV